MTGGSKIDRIGDRALGLFRRLFPLWLALLLVALLSLNLSVDPDLFARVAAGRLTSINGAPLLTDPFAFTVKKPVWIDHEWLSGWIFYLLADFGGDRALFLFKCLLAVYSVLFLVRAQRLNSPESASAPLWILIGTYDSIYVWSSTVRAQVFTYLFIPYLLYSFAAWLKKGEKRYLCLFPLVMLIWTNAHGGFVLGLALYFLFLLQILAEKRNAFLPLVLFLLGISATLINPYGTAYWNYIIEALFMSRPSIGEWTALYPLRLQDLFFHLLVILSLIGLFVWPRVIPLYGKLILFLSLIFAYRHMRLMAFFAMPAAVFIPPTIDKILAAAEGAAKRLLDSAKRVASVMGLCLFPALLVRCAMILLSLTHFKLDYSAYPVGAFSWLREHTSGSRLLVDFNNGSFALWRLFPNYLISVDGRYEEVYPQSTVDEVACALSFDNPQWKECFSRIDPDIVLVGREEQELLRDPVWRQVYVDNRFQLLSKNPAHPVSADNEVDGLVHGTDSTSEIWNSLF